MSKPKYKHLRGFLNYPQTEKYNHLWRKWREQIPRFAIPETADAQQRVSQAASVSPVFIELTNVAVVNQTALVRNDGTGGRQESGRARGDGGEGGRYGDGAEAAVVR